MYHRLLTMEQQRSPGDNDQCTVYRDIDRKTLPHSKRHTIESADKTLRHIGVAKLKHFLFSFDRH